MKYVVMFILGACIGSFLCCEARRLYLKETGYKKKLGPRSVCLHCKRKLKWYENIPIISWLALKGKCKKCGTKIGNMEIFSEVATGIIMALLAATIDIKTADVLSWAAFISLIMLASSLTFLALYDGAHGQLPTRILIFSAVFAVIYVILKTVQGELVPIEFTISALILGGLYLALYIVSKGKWVGDGDWILAGIIGLALGKPFLALIALFISNFSACIVMWPYVHKTKNHKIYFGPFLVFAFIVVLVAAPFITF
jgi:prepilin signal peptidase PulO-like enzyme (type II secretory pathway)